MESLLMSHHDTSLKGSFKIQLRVIGALLMREVLTRYGRHNIGFLWLFVEPMLFTIGVTALWSALKLVHGSSLPIVGFAVTGYSSVLLWRNCTNRCALAIQPNLGLLYHRNVKILDIFVSRLLLEIGGATLSLTILVVIFIVVGLMAAPADIGRMVGGWLVLILFSSALGLFVGALTERSDLAERLWHPVSYFLFPISGAVYMVDWLPQNLQPLALYLPMVSGVELLREGYYGPLVHAHYELIYAISSSLALMFVALVLVRQAAGRVQPE
jgi:capsular polysaccharide transport system permease protein